jgi:hypothetical protein
MENNMNNHMASLGYFYYIIMSKYEQYRITFCTFGSTEGEKSRRRASEYKLA